MSSKSKRKSVISTPTSIYIVGLWAIVRAATPILALIGQYNIETTFNTLSTGGTISGNSKFDVNSFLAWLLKSNASTYITLALAFVFLVIGIGLLFGKNWGRLGFLIVSTIMVFWNLRAITWGRYSLPLYSLVALGLAYWYFRQTNILHYFGAKDNSPSLINQKILGAPLDLAISLGILALLLVLELVGLLQFGMR